MNESAVPAGGECRRTRFVRYRPFLMLFTLSAAAFAAAGRLEVLPWGRPDVLAASLGGNPDARLSDAVAAEPAESEDVSVSVVHPRPGGIRRRTSQTGTLVAAQTAKVTSRISGPVTRVAVDIGSVVRAGDVLAELDVPDLLQDLRSMEAKEAKARSEVMQAAARLRVIEADEATHRAVLEEVESDIERYAAECRLREKEATRIRGLVDRGAVSETVYDEKWSELEQALAAEQHARKTAAVAAAKLASLAPKIDLERANIAAAEAALTIAETDVERSRMLVGFREILAPFSGVITERNCEPGDFVRPVSSDDRQPLFTVAQTDRMKVVVSIPDQMVPFIRAGDPATVRIESLYGDVIEAEVSRVAMSQDRRTRSMRAEIDLANPEGLLVDGMYGSVTIVSAPPDRGMVIPRTSLPLTFSGGQVDVWVVQDGQVARVPVRIGTSDEDRIEVFSGLSADDQVVINPTTRLRGGLAVTSIRRPVPDEQIATAISTGLAAP